MAKTEIYTGDSDDESLEVDDKPEFEDDVDMDVEDNSSDSSEDI